MFSRPTFTYLALKVYSNLQPARGTEKEIPYPGTAYRSHKGDKTDNIRSRREAVVYCAGNSLSQLHSGSGARLTGRVEHGLDSLEPVGDDEGDVLDLRRVVLLGAVAGGEHHAAEGAAGRDDVGTGLFRLAEAVLCHPHLAGLLLLPELRATGAAAEGVVAAALHLDQLAVAAGQDVAGRVVLAVVPAQVAGVVEGDGLLARDGRQLARVDELRDQLRVVDHVVLAAQLRVVVEERVEAVRAGGDDAFALVRVEVLVDEDAVEGCDVLCRKLVVEVLVAGAAGGIARALLALAQHRVVDAGVIEDLRHRAGGPLRTRVVGAGAAHPEEHLELGVRVDGGDLEALCPLHALVLANAPGVAETLHAAEGRVQLGREFALHHHLVAADVDDVDHLLATDGAHLHAGAAGGAGPQRLRGDREVGQVARRLLAQRQGARVQVQLVTLVDLQRRRAKRLAGHVRRAYLRAAVALDAGVGIQELRPAHVLELRHAVLLEALILEVDGIECSRGQLAAILAAALHREVDRRHEQVDVLRSREVGQEGEDEPQCAPPADVPAQDAAVAVADHRRERRGDGLPGIEVRL